MIRLPPPLLAALLATLASGCEQAMQDMYDQPKYRPYDRSELFDDGMAARPIPPHAVARIKGVLAGTTGGRLGEVPDYSQVGPVVPVLPGGRPPGATAGEPEESLPPRPPLTPALLRRGRERYTIYCAPCHSPLGDGDGMIPRRGFPNPPSYHSERLRRAPDAHFFRVITHGYGLMYAYASRVAPVERWAIIEYIRALQLSQHADVSQLKDAERAMLREEAP